MMHTLTKLVAGTLFTKKQLLFTGFHVANGTKRSVSKVRHRWDISLSATISTFLPMKKRRIVSKRCLFVTFFTFPSQKKSFHFLKLRIDMIDLFSVSNQMNLSFWLSVSASILSLLCVCNVLHNQLDKSKELHVVIILSWSYLQLKCKPRKENKLRW